MIVSRIFGTTVQELFFNQARSVGDLVTVFGLFIAKRFL